jgi:hypothetical protein
MERHERSGRVRRRPSVRQLALAALLAATSWSCGYRLVGTGGSILPGHVKKIVVVPFENRTQRPEIEQRVTEAVSSELSKRGRYAVVADKTQADAMLEGAVTQYRTAPVQFTEDLLANRVEAVVRIQATVRDLSNDQVLWSQGGLIFTAQFDVPQGGTFFEQESLALDEIAVGVAGALVTSILEGF